MRTRLVARLLAASLALPLGAVFLACHGDAGAPDAGQPTTLGTGDYVVTVSPDARTVTLSRRGTALITFPADGFEIGLATAPLPTGAILDPYWYEPEDGVIKPHPAIDVTWHDVVSAKLLEAGATGATLAIGFDGDATASLTITEPAPGRFQLRLVAQSIPAGQALAMLRLRPRASTTEGFYGLGEWGDSVEHRGHLRPTQLEADFALEGASDENHVPVPFVIGTNGWGLFVETHAWGAFDVARKEPDLVEATFGVAGDGDSAADGLVFHLFAAERPLDVTKLYYDVTGYPRLPAEWALGPWIWRNDSSGQAQIADDLQKVRDLDLATSAMWLDRPYSTAVETFDFDPVKYQDPQALIDAAHASGIRLGLWQAPYLEMAAEPYFDMANAQGFFTPMTGPLLNSWGPPIDFTNPQATAFWKTQIAKYVAMGIEGWKLDYGEDPSVTIGARATWRFHDNSDERTMHDGYTLLYHQTYQSVLPPGGSWMLCRTGRWGDQVNASVIWPGDLDATFTQKGETFMDGGKTYAGVGGLPASIADGLSLGPSGFPFFAADTGGYKHSPPTNELWLRWVEQTALSPVMHVGDASSETPWEFTADNGRDQSSLDTYRTYARLHMRLFPYEWTLAKKIASDGRPIVRALGLAYPELGVHPSDTYLFGDDLLVAPVIVAGASTRDVTLPPGDWIDWWDGTLYSGGAAGGAKVTVPAPLGKLPLLLRAGGVVPLLRPTIDTMAPTTTPAAIDSFATAAGPLYVRIEPSAPHTYTVYDGTTIASAGGLVTVTPGTVFDGGMRLEIVRTPSPNAIFVDDQQPTLVASPDQLDTIGANGSGWAWTADMGGTLWVALPPGMHQLTFCTICGK